MTLGSRQATTRRIRAGTLAFGIALLLRSDTAWDGVIIDLTDPEPEPGPDPVKPAIAKPLPSPRLGSSAKPAGPVLQAPVRVPSLSETLLGPKRARGEPIGPSGVKAKARASSALSGTFAQVTPLAPGIERAAFPSPNLSAQPPAAAAPEPVSLPTAPQAAQPEAAPPVGVATPAPAEPQPIAQAMPAETLAAPQAEAATPGAAVEIPASPAPPAPAAQGPVQSAPAPIAPEVQPEPPPPAPSAQPVETVQAPALPLPPVEAAPAVAPEPDETVAPAPVSEAAPVALALNEARPRAVDPPPVAAALAASGSNADAAVATPAPQAAPPAARPAVPSLAAVFAPTSHVQPPSVAPEASKQPDGAAFAVPVPVANGVMGIGAGPGPPPGEAAAGLVRPPNLQQIAGGAPPDISDDDELILELRLANGMLADTLVGYGTRNGIYLPLGALARSLDLAIVVSDDGNYASGWFLDEKRTLTIDLRQKQLEVLGKSRDFPTGAFVARGGEMYVLADYLGELLPLTLKADLRDQSVTITTREPFPFEARIAREEARGRLGNQNATLAEVFQRERTDWRLIDFPLMDLELRGVSDRVLGTRAEGDVRLSTDLAYMNAQTFFSASSKDGLTAARIELGRQDPDGTLLGPLSATEFQIGDVSTTALPIGLRGTSGRGAFVSNAKLYRASVFDKIDLRGELPDGYEVELYRNNVLIGSTRTAVNGRFEFLQVPVDFGLNVMRLVFYGPQGQRREEVRQIAVGDGRLAEGEFEYSLGMAQKERNLLNIYGPFFKPTRDFGAWRMTGQMSYGFTKDITGTLSFADFDTDLGHHWQVATGLRTGIGGLSARLDAALQNGDGKAVQLALGGRVLGSALTLSHAEYGGEFIDEVRSFDSAFLRRASELNLSGSIDFSMGKAAAPLPYTLRMRRLEFADGRTQADASLRGSVRLGTVMLSKSFEYQHNTTPGLPGASQLTGSFDLARLSGSRLDLRGGFGYRILPNFSPLSATVQADYAIDDRTLVNAAVGRSFDNDETFLGLSASRRFDKFTLSFDSNYSLQSKSYSVALRLGMSLGRNPISGDLFVDRPGLAGSGAVAIRAFHDKDGDERFGPADEPLEGVTFFSGNQTKNTDASGLALLGDLPGGSKSSLQVDQDTIQDITLAPRSKGFEVVPRPGRIHVKDFAIVDVVEVTGTATFDQNGSRKAVSALRLELIDTAGKVVAETRSESDGFFFFEQVVPGIYQVRIESEQAARLGIEIRQGGAIEVKAGQAVPALDLIIAEK